MVTAVESARATPAVTASSSMCASSAGCSGAMYGYSAGICSSVSGQIPGLLFGDGNPRAVETLYEATGT